MKRYLRLFSLLKQLCCFIFTNQYIQFNGHGHKQTYICKYIFAAFTDKSSSHFPILPIYYQRQIESSTNPPLKSVNLYYLYYQKHHDSFPSFPLPLLPSIHQCNDTYPTLSLSRTNAASTLSLASILPVFHHHCLCISITTHSWGNISHLRCILQNIGNVPGSRFRQFVLRRDVISTCIGTSC